MAEEPEYTDQYLASYYQSVAEHANFEYTDDQTEALPLPREQLDTFEDEEVETEEIPDESTKVFKKGIWPLSYIRYKRFKKEIAAAQFGEGHFPIYHVPETQLASPLFIKPVTKHANFEYTDDQAEALPLPGEQLDTFEDEEVETEEIPDEPTKVFKKGIWPFSYIRYKRVKKEMAAAQFGEGHFPIYHVPETQLASPLFIKPVTKHANFEYTDDQAEALPLPEEQLDTFEDEEVETEEIPDESTKVFKKGIWPFSYLRYKRFQKEIAATQFGESPTPLYCVPESQHPNPLFSSPGWTDAEELPEATQQEEDKVEQLATPPTVHKSKWSVKRIFKRRQKAAKEVVATDFGKAPNPLYEAPESEHPNLAWTGLRATASNLDDLEEAET